MTTWNELPAHLVSKIRSDSVTAPANLPGAVPVLKYGNRVTAIYRMVLGYWDIIRKMLR